MSEEQEKDKTAEEQSSEQRSKQESNTESNSIPESKPESNLGSKPDLDEATASEGIKTAAGEKSEVKADEPQVPVREASDVETVPEVPAQKLETVEGTVEEQKEAAALQDDPVAPASAESQEHADATKEVSVTAETEKPKRAPLTEEEKAARIQAAAEARAARAKAAEGGSETSTTADAAARPPRARAKEGGAGDAAEKLERPTRAPRVKADEEPPKPKEPSPKQPVLDQLIALLKAEVAEDAVEEEAINEVNDHLPTVTVKNDHWLVAAQLLREHKDWSCDYLRNLSGIDQETHLEVIYHLINLSTKAEVAVRVKTDREVPSIASVTPIWPTANWNEREVYDLLGISFPGHPDLRRIMMPDDWVGHPLRKDYVPLDSEV
ncbi:NuoC [Paenibacillus sp. E194]|uniref:NADH-quinone oxidoreductase subunit C n=1 Tax=Paenibacillus sp. E194 TaxID=1458845 RepID=UPI0005E771D0|nr:NADH-quinone oxidoreductase subunit C [Paenibacillus sp. E194]KJB89666.1 NuoC [Paenibacillus sp. E194]